ncbi:leucine-rich repeat protein [Paenibacillus nasutitermitis]|nr:leucine-rich repeat protein [Paenibacillus nasutitermitis]
MSFPVSTVHAAVDGDFQYEDNGDGTAIITDYTGDIGLSVVIPDLVGSGLTVVEIGVDAFKNNQLTSLTIPNNVTTIGQGAFLDNKLTSLTLPDNLMTIGRDAFKNNQLTSLTIPNSVTSFGIGAFQGNELTSLTLLDGLATIGVDAFRDNQLASLTIPDSVTTIGQGAFQANQLTNLTLPSNLTTIGVDAFRDNQLASLMIPDSVTTIGLGAFLDNKLTSLTLPDNLMTIGREAFKNNQLTSLTIPNSVTSFGIGAFQGNELTSLILLDGLATIGVDAFRDNQLASLTIPNSVTTIEEGAFLNNKLTSLTLPDNLMTIGRDAFKNNQLTMLTIPNSVTTIEEGAFQYNKLTNLTLLDGLATIGVDAFKNNQLTTLTIPNSVTTISGSAFINNPSLTDVLVLSNTVDFESNNIFGGSSTNLTLYGNDSSTSQTFATVNNHRFQKITAELADLELNIPGLTFDPEERTFNLTTNANAVIVTPTPVVPFSEVQVNHALVPYGSGSPSIDLAEGIVTITLDVEAPDNSTEQYTVEFNVDHTSPSIDLTASPTTPTNGNVTVTVGTDGTGSAIDSVKWATGSQVAGFFATGGQVLTGGSFAATVNGTYTVYARDEVGNESVETITISNIDRNVPTIDLTANPTSSTNGNVTVTVDANANSGISVLKWIAGNEGTAFFATGGEGIVDNEFIVTSNGTYTAYARDSVGNEAVETITISNIDRNVPTIDLTANPTSSTNGNVTVTVDVYAASEISALKWAAGNEGTAFFATGGEAIVGNEFTVTTNGTYTVYARDNAGNEAVETITISNIVRSSPTPPTSPGPDDEEDSPEDSDPHTIISTGPGVIIIEVAPRDIKELPKDNGGNKKVVNLPDDVWDEIPKLLDDDRPVIRVVIDDHLPDVELHLPGKRLAELWDINPNVEFDMQLNGSSFQLKVNVLDLEQLATRLGIAVDELNVIIKISALTGETKEDFILAADEQGMTLLSQVIEFQLFVSGGDEWVEITDFGGTYMTKSIVLDEQFANRNYMAVLYDPDGRTFTYVPAVMARRSNGQQDSVIQMPHNSIYAIVETDRIEFADMQGHWAEPEVEHLGSKRIVRGITINDYAPNRNITRAEFTSLLVRALGIKTDRTGAGDVFKDVAITSWYSTEVEAAFRAGLVSGISLTHFAPEAQITREQIALMLMNAQALVNDESNSIEQLPNSLTSFTDASEVSAWARDAMSDAVASKLIQGMSTDRLAPAASATRAQAAVMLHRLMVMIEFLD